MNKRNYRECIASINEIGFAIVDRDYSYWSFGNWWIEVTGGGLPGQRIWWDGRDNWVGIDARMTDGQFREKWVGKTAAEQKPQVVIDELRKQLASNWERDVRRAQEEYWQGHLLEQALIQAKMHWRLMNNPAVVSELEAVEDRLTPAERKRLEIARRLSKAP